MRDRENTPTRERWEAENDHVLEKDDMERPRESSRHRSKDKDKSSRKEEREHTSRHRERSKTNDVLEGREEVKDYEKSKISSRDRRKDERDRDEHDRVRSRDKIREKESDRDKYKDEEHEREKSHRDKGKEKEREREREREADKDGEHARPKERGKEKSKDRDKEGDKGKDREKNKEREKHKDRERERERGKDVVDREKGKDWEKEREGDRDKDRHRGREKGSRKLREEDNDRSKNDGVDDMKTHEQTDVERDRSQRPSSELEERILMMKEERMKKKSEGVSEVLSWVSKSRKLEEKRNSEKEKVLQLSKVFEEQDNINEEESDDLAAAQHTAQDLAGVKVLHGLDKVIEGGAVVLTLKDQSILAGGDINEEIDMLENVEIGEQKRRNEAYNAAKKKTGIYEDKFNEEPGSERKMLPQYDDPVTDEGVTLDASGRFSAEAEKKLEELRRRIGGASANKDFLDLNSSGKISSDYMTQEEMLQFKKPKKKKSLRKKEKLDIDALEAEALSSGLGVEDLGSRKDGKRQALRQEQERTEAKMRSNAYQSAYAKADEASKALRLGKILNFQAEEDDTPAFGDDDDDLRKSLERARKLAIKKQDEKTTSGPQAIALLASSTANNSTEDNQHPVHGESQENKVVFTEMEEFVWGLQLDEEAEKHDGEDVFMEEDVAPTTYAEEMEEDNGGLAEIEDTAGGDSPKNENKEDIVPDEVIHEVAVGKGLSSALKLLKERGTLKERIEWGGRNMDKKKGKLVGIYENDGTKEIRIERTDEYGRILTPKEAFRQLSHKFHGKGPGKKKQEKRMREYHEELKIKQMKNADTPSLSVERMREAQSKLKTPYLVLSGNVKPGQTSDPRSGFATVEKDFPGGLTPMLGDRKVEHFLGIKRKSESGGDMGPPKIPKT